MKRHYVHKPKRKRVSNIEPVKRQSMTRRKYQLARLYGWACSYCAVELTEKTATVDHIIPLDQHGGNHLENTCLACHRCNQRKANRNPAEAGMHPRLIPLTPDTNRRNPL